MTAPMSAAESGRFDRPPEKLLRHLQPFDFARHHGIKAAHVAVFEYVAAQLNVALLLRATNTASLPYMEVGGYTAKPIDCKAKTADRDVVAGLQPVECAGLVADPSVVGGQAYKGGKLQKAIDSWRDFESAMHVRRLGNGVIVYERADRKGFYAVDMAEPDTTRRHHGCLMVSEQSPPADFDPRKSHIRAWMRRHMNYVHGDYDLYGAIDLDAAAQAAAGNERLYQELVQKSKLLGQPHYIGPKSLEVVKALNECFDAELVKHGEQSAYAFTADDVYLFYPVGKPMVVLQSGFAQPGREMPGWFEDLYRYVFKTGYLGRERVSERALR